MNADAFRHLFDYHFAANRRVWDQAAGLTDEQFTRGAAYSHGSVRDQLIHLIFVDEAWFTELQGRVDLEQPDPASLASRAAIRAYWDGVEAAMRAYLAGLADEMLPQKPLPDHDEDRVLSAWQMLIQVVNHGTDHRAQILRQMSDLGVKTEYQDYIFYAYRHPF